MAVVLKSNKDTESTMGAPTFLNIITNKISNAAQVSVGNILQNLAMV